jgi:hypothetical protein
MNNFNPHHYVTDYKVEIKGEYRLYWLTMDCPVQPEKIVLMKGSIPPKDEPFDPHFSNTQVVARFAPNNVGWKMGLDSLKSLNKMQRKKINCFCPQLRKYRQY